MADHYLQVAVTFGWLKNVCTLTVVSDFRLCVPNYPHKQSRLYKQRKKALNVDTGGRNYYTAFRRNATDYTAREIQLINHSFKKKIKLSSHGQRAINRYVWFSTSNCRLTENINGDPVIILFQRTNVAKKEKAETPQGMHMKTANSRSRKRPYTSEEVMLSLFIIA